MMKQHLLATLALLTVTGCYNAKITAPVQQGGVKHADTGVSLFWGITNTSAEAIECPAGMAYTETFQPWWGVMFVQPLTLGIVTPIKKVWICVNPTAAPPAAPAAPGGAPPQVIIMQAPPTK